MKFIIAGLVVVILLLVGAVAYFAISSQNKPDPNQIHTEPNIILNAADADRLEKERKAKKTASSIGVKMLREVTFENGSAEGTIGLENPERNEYPFRVQISLANGGLLFESGLIPVGSRMETFKLNEPLEAGDYECVAMFTAYDEETNSAVGQVGLMLTLHILA